MNPLGTVLIAFLTSVLTAAGTVYVIQRYDTRAEQVAVPELRGLTEAEARSNLKAVGLVFLAAPREVSSTVKPGQVARQSIPPGQSLPRDHAITVALAEEWPKVPEVLGLAESQATARLVQAGYKVQLGEGMQSDAAAPGTVLEQSPKAETSYKQEKAVVLRLALAPEAVEMPKVLGQGINAAKAELEKLGLKVNVRWTNYAETPTFVVLAQKPEPKTKLKPGEEVDLSANR